jgi:hypothetical protein
MPSNRNGISFKTVGRAFLAKYKEMRDTATQTGIYPKVGSVVYRAPKTKYDKVSSNDVSVDDFKSWQKDLEGVPMWYNHYPETAFGSIVMTTSLSDGTILLLYGVDTTTEKGKLMFDRIGKDLNGLSLSHLVAKKKSDPNNPLASVPLQPREVSVCPKGARDITITLPDSIVNEWVNEMDQQATAGTEFLSVDPDSSLVAVQASHAMDYVIVNASAFEALFGAPEHRDTDTLVSTALAPQQSPTSSRPYAGDLLRKALFHY